MLDQVPGFSTPPPSDSMALVEHTGTEARGAAAAEARAARGGLSSAFCERERAEGCRGRVRRECAAQSESTELCPRSP